MGNPSECGWTPQGDVVIANVPLPAHIDVAWHLQRCISHQLATNQLNTTWQDKTPI